MSSRAAHQALTPGRAVLIRQPGSGLTELALVVGAPGGERGVCVCVCARACVCGCVCVYACALRVGGGQ